MKSLLGKLRSWFATRPPSPAEEPMQPEQAYVVTSDDERVACVFSGGPPSSVRWEDLVEIVIETNDEGPFLPDVFWIFRSPDSFVQFPQGAPGDQGAIDRAMKMPGYDFDQSIKAMRCTDNARFIIWRRPSPD